MLLPIIKRLIFGGIKFFRVKFPNSLLKSDFDMKIGTKNNNATHTRAHNEVNQVKNNLLSS